MLTSLQSGFINSWEAKTNANKQEQNNKKGNQKYKQETEHKQLIVQTICTIIAEYLR